MNYVTDDQGQVKVIDDKGNTKFLPKDLAENTRLMNRMKYSIVEKPVGFDEQTTEDSKKSKTKSK